MGLSMASSAAVCSSSMPLKCWLKHTGAPSVSPSAGTSSSSTGTSSSSSSSKRLAWAAPPPRATAFSLRRRWKSAMCTISARSSSSLTSRRSSKLSSTSADISPMALRTAAMQSKSQLPEDELSGIGPPRGSAFSDSMANISGTTTSSQPSKETNADSTSGNDSPRVCNWTQMQCSGPKKPTSLAHETPAAMAAQAASRSPSPRGPAGSAAAATERRCSTPFP
mmetsp:Transcript_144212/g.461793  ORF Transcript_144212/g.461793 Transcript_144212/m.461793 type:complete len:223 (+) Transcript_144212:197-865(+)